jgi:hypothetical protein
MLSFPIIVRFLVDCEITICENTEDEEGSQTTFKIGETADFDVIDHPLRWNGQGFVEDLDMVNVQFGDGSVAFGISKEWYEITEPNS